MERKRVSLSMFHSIEMDWTWNKALKDTREIREKYGRRMEKGWVGREKWRRGGWGNRDGEWVGGKIEMEKGWVGKEDRGRNFHLLHT
jgi:hypothetical protein